MPQNNENKGNGNVKENGNENGKGNENNNIVPITKINTTNQNKKGKIKSNNMLIATEEGQLPYMCIIS